MLNPAQVKPVDLQEFHNLASKGLSCKDIAKHFNISTQHFGIKMKKLLGVYPSIYIARLKNGPSKNYLS
jgi:YesN/AraC family two-component response regulator